MNGSFYIGATGLHAQQTALDMIANNIANINTPAFKRSEPRFAEMLAGSPADGTPSGRAAGVTVSPNRQLMVQGDLRTTGKPLDVAIQGEGFIELLGPSGQTRLWRGGTLKVSADGLLATPDGLPLKAMITVPSEVGNLTIGADGIVRGVEGQTGDTRELGRIELAMVRDDAALEQMDAGNYALGDESGLTTVLPGEEGAGTIVQGSLEAANVQLSDEMVALLVVQRAYAASAQLVQAGDQLMSIANGLRR